jgi:hypothetical protein
VDVDLEAFQKTCHSNTSPLKVCNSMVGSLDMEVPPAVAVCPAVALDWVVNC